MRWARYLMLLGMAMNLVNQAFNGDASAAIAFALAMVWMAFDGLRLGVAG